MFKKNYCSRLFLIIVFSFLVFLPIVSAEDSSAYRGSKSGKSVVNIKGNNIYFSAALEVNATENESDYAPIDNVVATYKNDTVYVTIKRSELNKVLKKHNFNNITTNVSIFGDYLDMDKNKDYYFFWGDFDNTKYYYETYAANYMMRTYNVFEVYRNNVSLVGYNAIKQSAVNSHSGIILFETDKLPSNYQVGNAYTFNQIDFSNAPIINLPSTNIDMTIVEDESIDLGKNTNIVTIKGNLDEKGNHTSSTIENVDVNNFYAKYFDDNKLNYSWTMYDKDGNPTKLDINTDIAIDDSSSEDNILSVLPKNISEMKDRIKFISFAHDGDLNGTAKISIYVGDKFKSGETLRLYYFNPASEELVEQPLKADNADGFYDIVVDNNGYVTLTFSHCSDYILTDLEVANTINSIDQNKQKTINSNTKEYKLIIGIVSLSVVIVIFGTIFIIRKHKKR